MIVIIMFGAYQTTRDWADLITLVAIGIFANLMKRYGWPRPPLLIGFVLASGIEINLYQSIQFYGISWLGHPIVLVLLALTAVSVWFGVRNRIQTELEDEQNQTSRFGNVAFALFVAGLAAFAIIDAAPIPFLGSIFPITVAAMVLPLAAWIAWDASRSTYAEMTFDLGAAVRNPDVRFLAWIIGFLLLGAVIGFLPAVAVFVAAFLMIEGNVRLVWSLASALVTTSSVYMLGDLLVIKFPDGLIPWPF
jgi:TctA family transporter